VNNISGNVPRNIVMLFTMSLVFIVMTAGVLLPDAVLGAERRSADQTRMLHLRTVWDAIEAYKADHGEYPSTGDKWRGDARFFGAQGYGADGYIPGLVPGYLLRLPHDPDPIYPTMFAGYMYRSNGTDYKFVVHLTPESQPVGNAFEDPRSGNSWMVSTSSAMDW